MSIKISELYGKKIISLDGKILGEVKDVVLNLDELGVSHLFLNKLDKLMRSTDLRREFQKNSIIFKSVKKISESIVVGKEEN